jgi:hypothetical protein
MSITAPPEGMFSERSNHLLPMHSPAIVASSVRSEVMVNREQENILVAPSDHKGQYTP